jgi:hypothetical protein
MGHHQFVVGLIVVGLGLVIAFCIIFSPGKTRTISQKGGDGANLAGRRRVVKDGTSTVVYNTNGDVEVYGRPNRTVHARRDQHIRPTGPKPKKLR